MFDTALLLISPVLSKGFDIGKAFRSLAGRMKIVVGVLNFAKFALNYYGHEHFFAVHGLIGDRIVSVFYRVCSAYEYR
jgi:dolichyl-phosphate-mannose--protein O-mannosyl transferase